MSSTAIGLPPRTGPLPGREVYRPGLMAFAALAVTYTVLVVVVCLWDGWSISCRPHSNLRFDGDAYRVNLVASGDLLDVAGVEAGDRIVAFDGQGFEEVFDLPERIRATPPGTEVTFTVLRDGRHLDLPVVTWRNLLPGELVELLIPLLAHLLLGVIVFVLRPGVPGVIFFLLFCLSTSINLASHATFILGRGALLRTLTFSYTMLSLPSTALLLHFFLVFPKRGRFQRRLAWLLPPIYAIQLGLGLHYLLPTIFPSLYDEAWLQGITGAFVEIFGYSVVACFALAALSLAKVIRSSDTVRAREQAKLLVLGFVVMAVVRLGLFEIPLRLQGRSLVDPFTYSLTDLVIPLAVTAAIVMHRLFDIDVIVRQSLVYGAVSILVAVVFVTVFGALGWAVEQVWSDLDAVALAVAAAAAAVVFHPVRSRVQDLVDRTFYRQRFDYRRALGEIAGRMNGILGHDELVEFLRNRIERLVAPAWVSVVVRPPPAGGGDERASTEEKLETPPGAALVVPMKRDQAVLGAIVLGPRRNERAYRADDREFLATLASLAVPILERGQLLAERTERQRLALVGSATGAIVHELKNPLAAIKSTVAVLRRRLPGDERGQELTGIVESEIDRLQDHVLNVLSWMRPGQHAPIEVDLVELLEQTVRIVEHDFSMAGVAVTFERPSQPVVMRADRERIRQAVLNLLLNAREAMGGGGTVTIRVAVESPGDGAPEDVVHIEVLDEGSGFGDGAAERATEAFYTTKRLGTGLGLANVKRIATDHGGEVRLANRPEGGARVALRLPRWGEG